MQRILIVDDDVLVLETLARMLRKCNDAWEVVAVTSGAKAVELASETDWSVVLMDMYMPAMNGLQAIAAIRSARPDLPVIAMSGRERSDVDLLSQAEAAGARRALRKPFAFASLVQHLIEVSTLTAGTGLLADATRSDV